MHEADNSWHVEYLDELQIVQLTYRGTMTEGDVLAASAMRMDLAEEKETLLHLIDVTAVRATRSIVRPIFDRVTQTYYERNVDSDTRIAILYSLSDDSAWIARFFEDVARSRGWNVCRFDKREVALKWLQS